MYLKCLNECQKDREWFLHLFQIFNLSEKDKELLEIYLNFQREIVKYIRDKISSVLDDNLLAALYICYHSIHHSTGNINMEINDILMNLRPKSFFVDYSQFQDFLADFKLDHRILRSNLKEIYIAAHRNDKVALNFEFGGCSMLSTTTFTQKSSRVDFREIPIIKKKEFLSKPCKWWANP